MKKTVQLTESELTNLIQRVITEGAIEDVDQAVSNQLKSPEQPISNNLDIQLLNNNILKVNPKNNPKSSLKFKVGFKGRNSFDIRKIDMQGCTNSQPKVQFNVKNGDFPLTWGVYRNLPGVGGWVFDKITNKWIKAKDVETNFVGQIDYEKYGYENKNDVQLQLWVCSKNEVLSDVFKDLQKTKFATASKGIPSTDLSITISKVA
jgi:hypothetical protein